MNTFLSLSTTTNHYASQGVIDLRNSEFITDSIALLDGDWFFSEDIHSDNPAGEYESVPGKWSQYSVNGNTLTSNGVGMYRLKILVPKEGYYCFRVSHIPSAYKFYVNEEQVLESGKFGTSYKEEVANWKQQLIPIYSETNVINVEIKVSNFHHSKGGIISNIMFGEYNTVTNLHNQNLVKSVLFIGMLCGLSFLLTSYS